MSAAALDAGLLMEAARAQQGQAEAALARLDRQLRGLDEVVRDEIRRTLIEELGELGGVVREAVRALGAVQRAAHVRTALWSVGITALCGGLVCAAGWWVLPSRARIAALRVRRDALAAQVARLERRGGRIDLRLCGTAARLCVRVDRKAPRYGREADYFVVKGY